VKFHLRSRRSAIAATACAAALVLIAVGLVAARLALRDCRNRPAGESDAAQLAVIVRLQAGMQVAEIGAGNGAMAVGIARRLGPTGRVYATEIGTSELEAIRKAASAAGLGNLTAVQAEEHSTALPAECCDLIYMHRVYHHFTDPASINRSLIAALKPGGRLAVIDFLVRPWMVARRHGIARADLIAQITKAGFTVERQVNSWSLLDYCVVFRKPAPGKTAATGR
jgi:ubiquinone/menaquinone biosynthesis C-methylase UbiE